MKKKAILFFISSLLTVSQTTELNFFQTVGSSELMNRILETTERNTSSIDHNISSSLLDFADVSMDMTVGDPQYGLKIFTKKLQKQCNISAAAFAVSHTQREWEAITEAGNFYEETLLICPDLQSTLQPKWLPSLYQFVYEYASDSGNIPSCND